MKEPQNPDARAVTVMALSTSAILQVIVGPIPAIGPDRI
jgi:hypothetical protein